jgi:Porin subfamily
MRVEVLGGLERRRHWSQDDKARIVEETLVPGAKGAYCAAFAVGHPGLGVTYTCNPDFNAAMLGVVTRWTPIKKLTFSGEVLWFHLDQKYAGTSVFGPGAPKPTTTYEFKDQDTVSLNVRVQRNF